MLASATVEGIRSGVDACSFAIRQTLLARELALGLGADFTGFTRGSTLTTVCYVRFGVDANISTADEPFLAG